MATVGSVPETMPSPDTGEPMVRGIRPFVVSHKGESREVKLPGYYPAEAGEGVHVGDDMNAVDDALRGMKARQTSAD